MPLTRATLNARTFGTLVAPTDFTPVKKGHIMSRRNLWTTPGTFLLASWNGCTVEILPDGRLMMWDGSEVTFEVTVSKTNLSKHGMVQEMRHAATRNIAQRT